jgi:hypothetical protein
MKKIIAIIFFFTISTLCFSQQIDSLPVLTKQDFLQKSKSQKTTAWIMLVGGAILTGTGMAIGVNESTDAVVSPFTLEPGPVLLITGSVFMLSSIPLFMAANKNKKKAMSLTIKNEKALQLHKQKFVYKSIPSISLKVAL